MMATLGLLHRERLRLTIGLRNVVFTFPQTTSKLKWNQNAGAPNELFCRKAVLHWVFCWENWSSFMCCWQDEIHLLGDFVANFLLNGHYCREAAKICFRTLDNLWKFAEIMDVRDETHIIHSCYPAGWEKY